MTIAAGVAMLAGAGSALGAQGNSTRHLYVVPGAHYGTPIRTSVALTAFLDGRSGVIGKGQLLVLEGGRDAVKAQLGLADISRIVGYSASVGVLRTLTRPPRMAAPRSNYAGAELHLYLGVINLGTGFYAPMDSRARKGLVSLNVGVGF